MRRFAIVILVTLIAAVLTGQLAIAKEPAQPELTLNQAIEQAILHNELIKKAEVDIERTEALREQAVRQLDFVPTGGVGYNPALEASWSSMLQADLTWRASKKKLDAQTDGLALDVCQLYWDVLKAQENLSVKEIALEKARLELQKSRAAYQLGMVSKIANPQSGLPFLGLEQAESNFKEAEGQLANAENELAKAYAKLNQKLGLWAEDRPVLIDGIEFNPLEIENLETEVNRALERSPAVWQAEQGVELQNYVQNLLRATGQYKPYEARQAEKEQAELDAINAKEATRILVRNTYYDVKNIEEQYKSLQKAVAVLEESLRVAELLYEVGMNTKADVIDAQARLAEAKKGLLELAAYHAYTKLVFQKPWAPRYSTLM